MPKLASAIHVIEKKAVNQNLRCVDEKARIWQTGYWVLADATAESLIGGNVYVHKGQKVASHKGGKIIDAYWEPGSDTKRKIIRFLASRSAEGVETNEKGWGNERKIVWEAVAKAPMRVVSESDESAFPEGRKKYKMHTSRERDSAITRRAKNLRLLRDGKLACEVCKFDFSVQFGSHGDGFIEAHHKVPVSKLDGKTKTRVADLALVCSNCHRMLHRGTPLPTTDSLKAIRSGKR